MPALCGHATCCASLQAAYTHTTHTEVEGLWGPCSTRTVELHMHTQRRHPVQQLRGHMLTGMKQRAHEHEERMASPNDLPRLAILSCLLRGQRVLCVTDCWSFFPLSLTRWRSPYTTSVVEGECPPQGTCQLLTINYCRA